LEPSQPPSQDASLTAVEPSNSYGQILKSSALIGGASIATLAIGMVRTKAMAILLGPAGFGLMSLYSSVLDLALSVAGFGINSAGVRQIAEASASGNADRVARTAKVLRRTSVVLGVLGGVALVALSSQVSILTFGNNQQSVAIALLALAVFLRLVADGQGALIQGMRRIADMAKSNILGALFGTIVSIPLVYFLGIDGVVPSLVAIAGMSALTAWWFGRRIRVPPVVLTTTAYRQEAASLLKLGTAFMASGLLMMGAAYAVRMILTRQSGLDAAGFYQSAWTLGGLYVAFILQAMGADFYPRLVGVAEDRAKSNRTVNEQAHVSLLLAGPGVLATIALAPLIIPLFYSAQFEAAISTLRWVCLGMALRVVSWPMGYIILARNARLIFFATEFAWALVNVSLAFILVPIYGADGAGMAFFGSYVFHVIMIYFAVRILFGFRLAMETRHALVLFLLSVGGVVAIVHLLPLYVATGSALVLITALGVYSLATLTTLVPSERLPQPLRRVLALIQHSRRA